MERVFVGLGSNLGDRLAHLRAARRALGAIRSTRLEAVSSLHATRPVGGPPQADFLNAAAELRTRLSPGCLLSELMRIEASRGRFRAVENGPRTLDLDLLLFGERRIQEPRLVVPHPRLHERAFVLEPLAELAPRFVHPVLGATLEELAARVRDPVAVRRHPLSGGARWPSSP